MHNCPSVEAKIAVKMLLLLIGRKNPGFSFPSSFVGSDWPEKAEGLGGCYTTVCKGG
jgi:hypothetical protein